MLNPDRIKNGNLEPDYADKLLRTLTTPIHISAANYVDDRYAPPTPIDPDNVIFSGIDPLLHIGTNCPETYRNYAIAVGMHEVSLLLSGVDVSEEMYAKLLKEVEAQVNNRANHNVAAMDRLAEALTVRPADDTMLQIIWRARCGMAELPELVRLIKEYPEMVSIEASNFRGFKGNMGNNNAISKAYDSARELAGVFLDAEVQVYEPDKTIVSSSASKDVEGVFVQKRVIADIKSVDSHTQMVLKVVLFHVGNGVMKQLGVTTYLRAGDYRERPGYEPEETELTEGALADLLNGDPERARAILASLACSAARAE